MSFYIPISGLLFVFDLEGCRKSWLSTRVKVVLLIFNLDKGMVEKKKWRSEAEYSVLYYRRRKKGLLLYIPPDISNVLLVEDVLEFHFKLYLMVLPLLIDL